ncbi:MAG: PorT family protein [Bacteroidetes bacterium]|nr:PorT family protein [Bacteroidota bacterium]
MKYPFLIGLLLIVQIVNSQTIDTISKVDYNYLEDQLYFSFHKVYLIDKPINVEDYGFSNGVSIGFIKDIPLNTQRNKGIGIGVGYTYSTYKNNVKLTEVNQLHELSVAEAGFLTNKLTTNAIEVPVEVRWRTSTPDKFKFWRVYPGFKITYLLNSSYSFISDNEKYNLRDLKNLNKWNYGFTLNAGYSTFNLYAYYGLKPLYNETSFGIKQSIKELKVGLIFYIL